MHAVPSDVPRLLSARQGRPRQPELRWRAGALAGPRALAVEVACWIAALGLIAGFGTLKLAAPLHRDAATFQWMASELHRGAVLYVDVWDLKQPGIFLFHWLAGRLFGYTPQGVHFFELLWQLAFAGIVIAAVRPLLRHRWLAAVAPAAFLSAYYVFCEPYQQTQLEILVGLPLFIVAWLTAASWRTDGTRCAAFFAAGLAAGVATAFKHVLAPIPVGFVLAAGVEMLRHTPGRAGIRLVLPAWAAFAAGVVVVWAGMAAAFWWLGALEAFLTTTFLYPLEALEEVQAAPLGRLAMSLAIFAGALAPWLLYASFAAGRGLRRDEPLLFRLMLVWLATAALVVLLQKSSWWGYHMLLLYPPVGVLAARGVDLAVRRVCAPRITGRLMTSGLLVLPVFAALIYPAGQTGRRLLNAYVEVGAPAGVVPTATGAAGPRAGAWLEAYRRNQGADYAPAADAAAFLTANAPPGKVYVFGDPTILLLSGREQAIATQGSAWEFYLAGQWRSLAQQLQASRPVWIFLEEHSRPAVEQRSPETMSLLAQDYRVVWDTPYGRWYARDDLPVE